jgi:hypothetical protein
VKSVQVFRVLFNIVHIIGDKLGSTWYFLLKNFARLEDSKEIQNLFENTPKYDIVLIIFKI